MNRRVFYSRALGSALGLILPMCLVGVPALAHSDPGPYKIAVTKSGFEPSGLKIPAGKRIKVQVHNQTALPAEFESYDFTVEKVVPGGTTVPVYIGPLKPGHYSFFNDFAPNVKGELTVR